MIRILFATLLLCSVSFGQSITVSTGRSSFIASGHSSAETRPSATVSKRPSTSPIIDEVTTDEEIREIRKQLACLASAVEEIRSGRAGGTYGKNPELVIHPQKNDPPRLVNWYLVSEPGCPACPAAKRSFLANGWPEKNIISRADAKRMFGLNIGSIPYQFQDPTGALSDLVARNPLVKSEPELIERIIQPQNQSGRYTTYQGRTYDWENETYGKCSLRNCPMCNYLYNACWSYRNSRGLSQVDDPQGPTPGDAIEEALDILDLKPNSVLAELGCGDGRVIVRAIQRCIKEHGSPCRAIGVEIDPAKVAEARRMILDHGLSSQVTILQGDVREFSPARHSVSHIYAYLYPELLQEISGTLQSVGTVVCPGHECTGIGMKLIGQCWVRKSVKADYQLTSQPIARVQQSGCSGGNCSRPQNRRRGLFR